jgi:hypothetical protein
MVAGPFVDGLVYGWGGLILSQPEWTKRVVRQANVISAALILVSAWLPGGNPEEGCLETHLFLGEARLGGGDGGDGSRRCSSAFYYAGPHEEQNRSLCLPFRVKLGQEGWHSVGW